nr:hypothetical protein [uncultured Chryseobacterium sp.]
MKTQLLFFTVLIYNNFFTQQQITGKVVSENDMTIRDVLVVNISNDKKTYSDAIGNFVIDGSVNDEIRFSKVGYERVSRRISEYGSLLTVMLIRIPEEIKEVEVFNLTGNLNKDSKRLAREDKFSKLQKDIGLPRPPEIMREKAPELSDAFVIGLPMAAVNLDALYKVLSGDARRMKTLYRYEDLQRYQKWMVSRLDAEYFINAGIPDERIYEFLEFAFNENPRSLDFVKSRNINGAVFEIEKAIPKYHERMKITNKK